jgi:hypothetical protein
VDFARLKSFGGPLEYILGKLSPILFNLVESWDFSRVNVHYRPLLDHPALKIWAVIDFIIAAQSKGGISPKGGHKEKNRKFINKFTFL